MEPSIVCQEILITPDSAFFAKEYQELLHSNQQALTQKQLLAEACWNGLLKLSLPEIVMELELVNVNEGDRILDLRFGKTGHTLDSELSLNPYLFLSNDRLN